MMVEKKKHESLDDLSHQSDQLVLRAQAFPSDANPSGDVFGGWVLSQMDIAGGIVSQKRCRGRTVTVAINGMQFIEPVFVGDVICCYASIEKEGKSSLSIKIEVWAIRQFESERVKVTEGLFTYVAVTKDRKKRSIDSIGRDED